MTFSLGTTNDAQYAELLRREAELLRRLTEIAKQRGSDDPVECANAAKRKTFRAIERKRSDKLNNWHYQKFKETKPHRRSTFSRRSTFNMSPIWLGSMSCDGLIAMTIEDARSVTVADLNPVEKRAVELLCGRKRKPSKNYLETRAEQLAKAVQREWFSPSKRAGRPRGTDSRKGIAKEGNRYDVPLSVSEVIDAVMPAIDELAGNKISGLQALVAAVHIVAPGASPGSIARMATRIRTRARESERGVPTRLL